MRACAVPLAALRTTVWFKGSPEFSARWPGLACPRSRCCPPWFKKRPNWNGFSLLQQSTPFSLQSFTLAAYGCDGVTETFCILPDHHPAPPTIIKDYGPPRLLPSPPLPPARRASSSSAYIFQFVNRCLLARRSRDWRPITTSFCRSRW